jgi:hypothetical protein
LIVTKLQGGLGNQLFQWAASKSLSVRYNTDCYFDLSYFNTPSTGLVSKWNLEIDKLNIDFKSYQFGKINLNLIIDDFCYREIDNNSFLDGYWQSEKYFIDIENIIRGELKVNSDIHNYIINKYPVLNDNTVSLHVRRGDYLNLQDYHPIQTIDYYNKAYDIINDLNISVVVLSNDINWCKENIKFDNITYIEGETNIVDLYIMSLCEHNVIANSSFSWWGAWLNDNKNKKVIAPVNWFGPSSTLYTGDIIPKNWIKI